jgi:hypothetical protein
MSAETPSSFGALTLLARALCEDARIGLVASTRGWAWDPARRTILVDCNDLERSGLHVAAGVIAHEVGHARVSRMTLAGGADLPAPLAHLLLNALEDRRCEAFIADRYPGTASWLAAARDAHREDLDDSPLHVQFLLGAADSGSLDGEVPVAMDDRVRAALARTRADRLAFRDTRPDAELSGWAEPGATPKAGSAQTWHDEGGEAGVLAAAAAAVDLAERRVRPVYASLVAEDAMTLALAWRQNAQEALKALRSSSWPAVRALAAGGGTPTWDEAARALGMLGRATGARSETLGPARLHPGAGGTTASSAGRADDDAGEARAPAVRPAPAAGAPSAETERAERVREHVARLAIGLEAAFPRRRPSWGRGVHESGGRPSLAAVLRLEANPRSSPRVWERRTSPHRRSAAVLLLVDLSGSMGGAKIKATLDAVQMLVSALGRLSIPLAVFGFQDELIPVLPFAAPLPDARSTTERIDRMADEVLGRAEGGHNRPRHNDDGPCLDAAARILAGQAATDRLLLVLSDGAPEGAHSGPDDLHAAVRRWSAPTSPVRIVGIGIASGAVSTYYPDCVAGVSPEDLPAALGKVLAVRLAGVRSP